MGWRKVVAALRDGSGQMLNVAATCAAAGIIVGVVAKTGPRAQVQRHRHRVRRRQPVSHGAVHGVDRVGDRPRGAGDGELHHLRRHRRACAHEAGGAGVAAHMFIFYYAVLSEVSPPTALSPFAAAAITGGDPYLTTLQSWKYTLPAFIVPFVFVLDPAGVGLLLKMPKDGSWSASRGSASPLASASPRWRRERKSGC
jgi:hypothetical protein